MHFVAFASIFIFALLALCLARTIRVWIALRDLLELPNLIQIHRVKKSAFRQSLR